MTERYDTANLKGGLTPFEFHKKRDTDAREHYIANAHQAILREKLSHCVKTEGVNQFVNCKELREAYMEICRDRYHGQIFAPDDQPRSRQVPGLIYRPPTFDPKPM